MFLISCRNDKNRKSHLPSTLRRKSVHTLYVIPAKAGIQGIEIALHTPGFLGKPGMTKIEYTNRHVSVSCIRIVNDYNDVSSRSRIKSGMIRDPGTR